MRLVIFEAPTVSHRGCADGHSAPTAGRYCWLREVFGGVTRGAMAQGTATARARATRARWLRAGLAFLGVAGLGDLGVARAQSYTLEGSAVVPAGGAFFGAGYVMGATVGQPATGLLAGGDYLVLSGFWPATFLVEPEPGPPLLIQWAPGFVVISWPWDATGYVLEASDDLAEPNWRPLTQTNPAIVPTSGGTRFFRLVRP